jgi:RimJ/RimL family protein N-acetyltransferase
VETRRAPHLIRLETENYVVRTLEPADATAAWGEWLTDPEILRNLNAAPRRMSIDDLRTYIARFNRIDAHILGTFEKATGQLIGIRSIYIDWAKREFLINTLIGDAAKRHKGVLNETTQSVFTYFFETLDLLAARASAVSTNTIIVERMMRGDWILERTDRKPAAGGVGFVELLHFRRTRELWRQRHVPGAAAKSS